MSAFICSDLHFSIIAQALSPCDNVQGFANELKRINIESVNFRYSEKTRFSKVKIQGNVADYTRNDIAKLLHCWVYQSCEKDTVQFHITRAYLESRIVGDNYEYGCYWTI